MKQSFIIFILLFQLNKLHAQDTSSARGFLHTWSTDLLVGLHWQGDGRENAKDEKLYRYIEIGLAKGNYTKGICSGGATAVYVSEEMYFGKDKNIFGTKVGAWTHYLIDIGLSLVYYTDFKRGNFKIRPEFGAGLGGIRAVVGYNIPTIDNNAFTELSHHNMQVSI